MTGYGLSNSARLLIGLALGWPFVLLSAGMPLEQVFFWSVVPGVLVLLLLMVGVDRHARHVALDMRVSPARC